MHDGIWYAWHAARRYKDQQINPEKYKKIEEAKKQVGGKVNWTINKVLQIHGLQEGKQLDTSTLTTMFGK